MGGSIAVSADRRTAEPPPGLFRDVLLDPDRERIPEAAPVVSFREDDEPAFLQQVMRRALARVDLVRRGVWHGSVAALDPRGLLPPRPRRKRRFVIREQRWRAAQPIFLPGALEGPWRGAREAEALRETLAAPDGLRAWLGPRTEVRPDEVELFDPERDQARVALAGEGDLWVKTGRLSTHPEDHSLRLRVAFGREGDDDASTDEAAHRRVAQVGRTVVPGMDLIDGPAGDVMEEAARLAGTPFYATQPIAYWNAPGGGARFHHDGFSADDTAPGGSGQRGVLYLQLTGATLWLALSIEELALRVRELFQYLDEGELPWLAQELELGPMRAVAERRDDLLAELGRPGCGVLGPLVDRGPEFTCLLADAGHAIHVGPGDALLLPNHGLARTAMHSVFCASGETAYGLSLALRADAPSGA